MIPRIIVLVLALLSAPVAYSQSIDYAKSEIVFVSRQMNVPVEGRFKKFTAHIDFDPKKLDKAAAKIEVDLGSIDTGSADADTEVQRKTWLNVPAFPAATFVSTGLKRLGEDRFEVRGKLTIKGVTRDLAAPFTITTAGGATTYQGGFSLARLSFNIGEGEWSDTDTVANEVQLRFRIVQTAKN